MAQQYGYGGRQNPFDQRDNGGYGGGGGYDSQQGGYQAPGGGYNSYGGNNRYDQYGSNNVEMAPLAQNAGPVGGAQGEDFFSKVRRIGNEIEETKQQISRMEDLQRKALGSLDPTQINNEVSEIRRDIMDRYKSLTSQVQAMKSDPKCQQSQYMAQLRNLDTKLKGAMTSFQQSESSSRHMEAEQIKRQYKVVNPYADDYELQQVVDNPNQGQVFQQALMSQQRSGQARAALTAVQDRHAELQRIERQMAELAELFVQLDTIVQQQDVAVVAIEQKGEETVENLDKGNTEIGTAINTARATRKKKWICLGICVAVVVIIAVAVGAYVASQNSGGGGGGGGGAQKRAVEDHPLEDMVTATVESAVKKAEAVPRRVRREANLGARWMVAMN